MKALKFWLAVSVILNLCLLFLPTKVIVRSPEAMKAENSAVMAGWEQCIKENAKLLKERK